MISASTTSSSTKSFKGKEDEAGDNFWSTWGVSNTKETASPLLSSSTKGTSKATSKSKLEKSVCEPSEKESVPVVEDNTQPLKETSQHGSSNVREVDTAKPGWTDVDLCDQEPPVSEDNKSADLFSSDTLLDSIEAVKMGTPANTGPLILSSTPTKPRKESSSSTTCPSVDPVQIQTIEKNVDNLLTDLQPITAPVAVNIETVEDKAAPVAICGSESVDCGTDIPKSSDTSNILPSSSSIIDVQVSDSFIEDPKQTAWGDDVSLSILAESEISTDSVTEDQAVILQVENQSPEGSSDNLPQHDVNSYVDDSIKDGTSEEDNMCDTKEESNLSESRSSEDSSSLIPEPTDSISASTEIVTDSLIAEAREQVPGLISDPTKDYTHELHVNTSSPLANQRPCDEKERVDIEVQAGSELDWTKSSTDMEESSEALDELSESNHTITSSESNKTLEGEPTITEECEKEDASTKGSTEQPGEGALSSSSYVKNMLEEAMTESLKDNDSHTDSHSSSDMVRVESGHTSGHTSADEIDTTTSSDIEIISHISTPTPNGDYGPVNRPFDLSPLRHALSRSVRRGSPPGHKRSDSGSSGTSYRSHADDLISPDSSHSGGSGKNEPDISETDRETEGSARGRATQLFTIKPRSRP